MDSQRKSTFSFVQNMYGYAFILPAFVLMIVFVIYPICSGLLISFTSWDGIHDKALIGLDNYVSIFHDRIFYTAIWNTLYFVVGTVPFIVMLSLIFAVLLNAGLKGTALFRGIYFLPAITSGVAISVIWKWIYNTDSGLLNSFLYRLGLPTPDWLGSTRYAMLSIIIMSIWKSLGPNIIIMLSGLQSISGSLYEAAEIDSASKFQKFRYITVPLLSPTIFFISVISIIGSFQVFEQVLVMTDGGPGNSTMVMVFYIYREAFENFNMGYASALSFVLFIIILMITFLQWIGKKYWVHSELE